jgi:large subunit ribosomal protein L17
LHARRTALAVLRQKNAVKKLFDSIAPRSASRKGGYTRIIRLGQRKSDSASVAFLEWVDAARVTEEKPLEEKPVKAQKEPAPAPAAPEEKPEPAPKAEAKPKRRLFGRKPRENAK